MNSSEQKSYEQRTPTKSEVQETVVILKGILSLTGIDLPENVSIKEGYQEAFRIISLNTASYGDISSDLATDKAKAIAVMAVDYLNGECKREVLTETFPIQKLAR